ncbi:efflux RND transporter periplasmic adaptor subunit [Sinomicrobium weinanense]|uniref:Efflux RND transporter periplasmic adaptor subunit n=1 Tax=Sinomicrobium weinanense TaxID=2842200 RepID=A0A926JPF5_9FLAO|nr:efflux RND transporter periplasmic adaptor subunit [Sinomicrobium weinanense]MBC9794971.1 efflux RND transporter periplasmic adaptor subunit [Sinomicrobium weinanense]MBU3125168.1 efflux RND transporter periplasmic adaptor subunit [Sinomicrobium weinanense]
MKTIHNSILAVFTVLAVSCNTDKQDPVTKASPGKENVISLSTIKAKKDTVSYTLSLPGELYPYESVTLYAKIEGFVDKLYVDRGSQVKKDQLLATLDAPEIAQHYLAARAKQREVFQKLNFSEANYRRMLDASRVEGAVSTLELEQANTRFLGDSAAHNAIQAEMEAAEELQNYTRVKAPFSGVITRRPVSPGTLVGNTEEPLFDLARQNKLRLVVAIPEKHAQAIQDSVTAVFTVNSLKNRTFRAGFSRSSVALDPQLRSLMVEFDVDNPGQVLKAGSYARVQLNFRRSTPSVRVLQSSIIRTKSENYVARVIENKINLVPVDIGLGSGGWTEISGAIEAGDIIVKQGSTSLTEGMPVQLKD